MRIYQGNGDRHCEEDSIVFGIGCRDCADHRRKEGPLLSALQVAHQELGGPNQKGVGRNVEHDLAAPKGQFRGADQQQRHRQRGRRFEPVARQAKRPPCEEQQEAKLGQQC